MYEDMFQRAVLTFRHQWAYDPVLEDLVHLNPLPSNLTISLDFLGPSLSRKLGQAIARAEVDPIRGIPFESITGLSNPKTTVSVGQRKRQMNLPIQKNLLTNYFLSASSEAKRQFRAPRNNDLDRIYPASENDFQSFSSMSPATEILDRKSASALYCSTSDFSYSIEEEDQLLSFLNSKMACAASRVSVNLDMRDSASHTSFTASATRKNGFQRQQRKCIIRSCYFSKTKAAEKPPTDLDTETSESNGYSLVERCFDCQNPDMCNDRNPGNEHPEVPTVHGRTEGGISISGLQVKQGCKSIDHLSVGEKKHIPMFSSKLLGDNIRPGKFASDTSHVEQYASIAQKSMERFVASIAPFRCLTPGARASGLRRPIKSGLTAKANRLPCKASKSVEDLRQFAFTRSNRRSSLSQEESVPGMKSVARLNEYLLSEWD